MTTAPAQSRRTDQIQDVLRALRGCSAEVTGAAIVSAEGFTAAALLARETDEEVVAGMSAALLGMAKRVSEELLKGDMQQTFVKSANGYIILNPLGTDAVLVVLASENAKLGLVLFEIERRLAELSKLL